MKLCLAMTATILALALPAFSRAQAPGGGAAGAAPEPAEVTEPSLPDNPTSPTDFQGPVTPPSGGAAPAAGAGQAAGEAQGEDAEDADGDEKEGPAGYSGSDYVITDSNPSLWGGVRQARQGIPDHHLVKQGDTLWDLSTKYYGDPWAWPQIWAYNKQVTNPHWIYPGDKIRLLVGGVQAGTGEQPERRETIRFAQGYGANRGPIAFQQNAFVDPKELAASGKVSGSREPKLLLAPYDEIYLKSDGEFKLQRGEPYHVYRVRKKLKGANGEELGYLVVLRGAVRLRRAPEKQLATAEITESTDPIERGDRVGPLRRRYRRVSAVPASCDLNATVVEALADRKMHAVDDVVFIDKGKADGVVVGNRFLVIHQGDGIKRTRDAEDDKDAQWPDEVTAEITVLDVRDKVSIGLITSSVAEVRVGDKVQMRKRY